MAESTANAKDVAMNGSHAKGSYRVSVRIAVQYVGEMELTTEHYLSSQESLANALVSQLMWRRNFSIAHKLEPLNPNWLVVSEWSVGKWNAEN